MAARKTTNCRLTSSDRGQGAVETLLALPVLLLLIAVILQICLIVAGKILLRYAAFYAARVGVVRGANLDEMEKAVGRILTMSGIGSAKSAGAFQVEVLTGKNTAPGRSGPGDARPTAGGTLSVRVTWDFPLLVPIARELLAVSDYPGSPGKSGIIPLSAAWTLPVISAQLDPARRED